MYISKVSAMGFYGAKATAAKKTIKNADEETMRFIEDVLKPKDEFVNFNQSAYSVPTGEYPIATGVAKIHPFTPYDKLISDEYLKAKERVAEPEVVDFISESSILK